MTTNKHPQAELMLSYANDAMGTSKPWELWEYNIITNNDRLVGNWLTCTESPMWDDINFIYRRKQKTIRIGNSEVPEPLQELPAGVLVAQVYVVCLHEAKGYLTPSFFISKTLEFQKELIAKQICHLKKEAAELHAKALLSFTTMEINK